MKIPYKIDAIYFLLFVLTIIQLAGRGVSSAQGSKGDEHWLITAMDRPLQDTQSISMLSQEAKTLFHSNPDTAFVLYKRILNSSLRLKYEKGINVSMAYIAEYLNNSGRYEEALRFLKWLETQATLLKLKSTQTFIYNSLGVVFGVWGEYDSAAYYYDKVVEHMTNLSDSGKGGVLNNYSALLINIGQYEKALFYLQQGETIAIKTKNDFHLTQTYLNMGNVYSNSGNWDKAEAYLTKALSLAEKNDYRQWHFAALTAMGYNYFLQQKNSKAIETLQKAFRLHQGTEIFYSNAALTILGKVYRQEKDYPNAIKYLQLALKNAQSMNIGRDIMECNKILAHTYAETGRFGAAFQHHVAYVQVKDSLESVTTKKNVNQLETKYRTTQKDKVIAEKQLLILKKDANLKQKNNWIIGISSGALFLAVLGTLIFSLYRAGLHKRRLQEQQLRTLQQEQEIKQMKAIIEGEEKERDRVAGALHDGIGGMLASLKMNIGLLEEEYPQTQHSVTLQRITEQLSATTHEVRRTAHNLMPDILRREGLKEALLHFSENAPSEKLKIELHYHFPLPLSKGAEVFLYRVIQELTQNVIKHAQATQVVMQVMLFDNEAIVTVEDNGTGFNQEVLSKGTGLKNIRSRVESLSGIMSISASAARGTMVQLSVPYPELSKL